MCDDAAGCAVPPTAAWPLVAAGARPLARSAAAAPPRSPTLRSFGAAQAGSVPTGMIT